MKENVNPTKFDLEKTVLAYVGSLGIKLSSQRTYAHWILGQMARSAAWRALDEGRVLMPALRLRELYRRARAVPPKQSPAATIAQLKVLPEPARSHLLAAFALCARLGDYVKNAHTVVLIRADRGAAPRLQASFATHKTVGVIGPKDLSVDLTPELAAMIRWPPPGKLPSLEMLRGALASQGLAQHSIRRGGVQYLISKHYPEDYIMRLTLHMSLKNYYRYVNTLTTRRPVGIGNTRATKCKNTQIYDNIVPTCMSNLLEQDVGLTFVGAERKEKQRAPPA